MCRPVKPPAYHTDARVMLRRVADAFISANGHIAACREWYEDVRSRYAQGL